MFPQLIDYFENCKIKMYYKFSEMLFFNKQISKRYDLIKYALICIHFHNKSLKAILSQVQKKFFAQRILYTVYLFKSHYKSENTEINTYLFTICKE